MSVGLDARIRVRRPSLEVEADLEVPAGETLAITGPSGAGKTTLLDALSGLVGLDAGRVLLGGETLADAESRIHLPPSRRRVGRLGQEAELFPHLSVLDNITFAVRARGETVSVAQGEAEQWLGRAGLADLGPRPPATLSGGQARRVALLRTLSARPRLLLLDEPFASLDVEAAADMRALIATQLRELPTTTILVSHDARDALALANRMIVLESGRSVQSGSVSEILAAPATRFAAAFAATVGLPDRAAPGSGIGIGRGPA